MREGNMQSQIFIKLMPFQKKRLDILFKMAIEEDKKGKTGVVILQTGTSSIHPNGIIKGSFIPHKQAVKIKKILDEL
jgi:hypothetical protein